jgi:hypothetical protein
MTDSVQESGEKGLLVELYAGLFRRPLPLTPAALLIGTASILLFAYEKPWTASDGLRNWGDWLFQLSGLVHRDQLLPPTLYSGSVLNVGLLLGALSAALLAREFAVRVAPPGELLKGLVGGLLMGIGAMLSLGCNIGGFFSALSAFSLSGFAMMIGLLLGAYLGLGYLSWELDHLPALSSGPTFTFCAAPTDRASRQPLLGALLLVAMGGIIYAYARANYAQRGGLLVFGVILGLLLQRSRFCLVRAFREPFMTGESEPTRAAAIALLISMLGFAVLKSTELLRPEEWVFPSFWLGSGLGGLIFGLGMVLAGGCGAGSIWRAGEGHVKLWVAVVGFALSASLTRRVLETTGWLQRLGQAVYLPEVLGWPGAMAVVLAVLALWYLFAVWNERSRRLVMAL